MKQPRKKRSGHLLAGLAATLALVVSGCSSAGSRGNNSQAETLRAVVSVEPPTSNPVHAAADSFEVIDSMFDDLIGTDKTGQPDGSGLATSWKRLDDLRWEFKLREGV